MLKVALFHGPMANKQGQEVTTSITNIDIHDIARSCRTFGVEQYYVVHPLPVQRQIASRITGHWRENSQKDYNLDRSNAFQIVSLAHSYEELRDLNPDYKFVATSARKFPTSVSFEGLRDKLTHGNYLIGFGTGSGMTEDFIQKFDFILDPIESSTSYNHLSVRSATAIVLDRLLGKR